MAFEIGNLASELRYQAEKTPQSVIQDFDKVEATDREYSQARKKYQTRLTISIICIFGSLFLMFLPPLGISILVIAIITTFYFYHHYKRFARLKIEPYRYFLVKKLAELLQRDLEADGQLKIDLDFTKPIIAHKLISEGEHPYRSGWRLKVYRDPWLEIEGQFCDRTSFKLNITENHRNVSGWKRSRSGKRKHKSKNKFKGSAICLQLRYSQKKYGAIRVFKNDAVDAIKLPQCAELKNFKLTEKLILIKANVHPPMLMVTDKFYGENKLDTGYQTVTAMLLSAYQILNLARTLSKTSN